MTNILLHIGHAIRPTENIMGILCITHKGKHMHTVKKYYICKKQKKAPKLMTNTY
jgi:hypothetical protein